MVDAILTLNAGSSSIKFALFEVGRDEALAVTARGEVESVNDKPHFLARGADGGTLAERRWDGRADFDDLLEEMIAWAEGHLSDDRLVAVGHRVVHGGSDHVRPERVTAGLIEALNRLTPLAPLHEPHTIAPMKAIARLRKTLPQVACFDTAFHHTMPDVARRFALPRDLNDAGVRRYGFHGLSYEFIAGRLRAIAPALAKGKVIAAHLGSGASLCAMTAGRSVDTTMGFTALDGLMMGTRCGTLDPGVILYLQQQRGMTVDAVQDMLYYRSGLLGVSGGIGSDMRKLLSSEDPHAREAVDLFTFRIARDAGALVSSLGGLDGLVFTAGIGEHSPEVRAGVVARLGWLGAELDAAANEAGKDVISKPGSRIEIRVVPTDEEAVIARHTSELVLSSN